MGVGGRYFYPVDGMDVLHAVQYDPTDFLQRLVWPHDTDGIPLYQHVTLRQQFNSLSDKHLFRGEGKHQKALKAYLECTPIWANDPLPSLHESFLIVHEVADFDNIAGRGIVQYLHCLGDGNTSREQFK